uniref:Uncharacterized protein n=1 Tax=Zea mays TaxID=4577 RepID=A0A804LQF7_MAIZE
MADWQTTLASLDPTQEPKAETAAVSSAKPSYLHGDLTRSPCTPSTPTHRFAVPTQRAGAEGEPDPNGQGNRKGKFFFPKREQARSGVGSGAGKGSKNLGYEEGELTAPEMKGTCAAAEREGTEDLAPPPSSRWPASSSARKEMEAQGFTNGHATWTSAMSSFMLSYLSNLCAHNSKISDFRLMYTFIIIQFKTRKKAKKRDSEDEGLIAAFKSVGDTLSSAIEKVATGDTDVPDDLFDSLINLPVLSKPTYLCISIIWWRALTLLEPSTSCHSTTS